MAKVSSTMPCRDASDVESGGARMQYFQNNVASSLTDPELRGWLDLVIQQVGWRKATED